MFTEVFDDSAVKLPASGVVTPIDVLLIVDAAVGLTVKAPTGLIATVPVPVGDRVIVWLDEIADKLPNSVVVAANVPNVKVPAGLTVTVPVPVGEIATLALAGDKVTVLLADNVVNAPAAATVPPIAGGDAKYVLNPTPVTVLLALNVVNAPVPAAVAPIFIPLILPVVAEVIVIVPAPVVVCDWLLVVVLNVSAPVALSVVNAPAAGAVPPIAGGDAKYVLKPTPDTVVVALSVVNAPAAATVTPIDVLLIVDAAVGLIVNAPTGLIVTVPVPVGDIVTFKEAGDKLIVPVPVKVVNAPAAATVPPIAGGDAKYVLNPVPDTVLLAASVVNAPDAGVTAPTVPFNVPANPVVVKIFVLGLNVNPVSTSRAKVPVDALTNVR